MSIALAYLVSVSLTVGLLWTVSWLRGMGAPIVDLLIIAALCSGLAPLPRAGLILATLFMALLVLKVTDAEVWPDAIVMIIGSNAIWILVYGAFTA